jgi:hypothetical protein
VSLQPADHWPSDFTPLEKDPEQCQVVLHANVSPLMEVACSIHGHLENIVQTAEASSAVLRIFREHVESETA